MTTTAELSLADAVDVTLGVPLDGSIRLWIDNSPSLWRIDDAERLAGLIGTGAIVTDTAGPARQRDCGLFDTVNHVLCVETTTPISRFGGLIDSHSHFDLEPAEQLSSVDDHFDLWAELEEAITKAAIHAHDRGEVLVVSGYDADAPSVTIGTITMNLRASLVVSAAPAPTAAILWPDPSPDERRRVSVLSGANSEGHLDVAMLTSDALRSWGVHPHEALFTYVTPIELLTSPLRWCADR